ncbi:MAG: linked oxidase domain protein [Frankiales bacterium]|nr:linked oxidase domain protein [Frankiales bacterium]
MTRLGPARAESLRGLCGGAVYLPGDPGYDSARAPWNVAVEHFPVAVTYPAFPEEAAAVLRAAASAGLGVAVQGTGHGAAPFEGRLGDAVLLRTSAMTELAVSGRSARVGAGVLWGSVTDLAGTHGLAALHASTPDVGVVGYSLGGGISWYARSAGLQSSAVTAAELVLADGSFVRCSDRSEPDLFWALRGGGGGLGVVTAIEFDLLPLPDVVAGMLVWDWTAAEAVLPLWAAWATEAPDEVTTSFRVLQAPDIPEVPAELRGRRLVVIDGAVVGEDAAADDVLAPLRAARPELDTFARVPASSLSRMHLEPEGPAPGYAKSSPLRELPPAAVDALLSHVGPDSGSTLTVAELRQLGGAVGRADPRGGVLDRLDGQFLALGIGLAADPVAYAEHIAQAGRLLEALSPWATGSAYLPMLDESVESRTGFPSESWSRLQQVRSQADPRGLLVAQHS